MSKIKEQMMKEEYDQAFQMIQTQLFEELVQTGSPNTEFPPLNPYALGGGGPKAGNNFSSPSMTKTTSSAASKPETLTLNAQARRNTTTKEKSLKAGQYTKAHKLGNFTNMNTPVDFEKALEKTQPKFYWNEKKKCVEEMKPAQFVEL